MAIFDEELLKNYKLDPFFEDYKRIEFSYEDENPILVAYEFKDHCEYEIDEEALNSTIERDIWSTITYDIEEVKNKIIDDYANDPEISRENALKILVSKTLGYYEEYVQLIERRFGAIECIDIKDYVERSKVQYNMNASKRFIAKLIDYLHKSLAKYPNQKDEINKYIEIIKKAFNHNRIMQIVNNITLYAEELDSKKNEEVLKELGEREIGLRKVDKIIEKIGYKYTLEEIYSIVPKNIINEIFFYGPESEQYISFITNLMRFTNIHCMKIDGKKYESQEVFDFVAREYIKNFWDKVGSLV